jgi:hypothetical protein
VATCGSEDFAGQWWAAAHAIRSWAVVNPHEYALVYGSPIPGYRAPEDTVGPASRVTLVLAHIVSDAAAAGALRPLVATLPPLTSSASAEADTLIRVAMPGVDRDTALRAIAGWSQLFGLVSFELFGHLHGVVEEPSAVFDRLVLVMGSFIGLHPGDTLLTSEPSEEEDEEWYLI